MNLRRTVLIMCSFLFIHICQAAAPPTIIWRIGQPDNAAGELALAPDGYKGFLEKDFGFEDRYFLVGHSTDKNDFPYTLPGPDDTWGGTWGTSGWRTHDINILFNLESIPTKGDFKIVVDLVDLNPNRSVVKVTANDAGKKFELKGSSAEVLEGHIDKAKEQILEIPLTATDLKVGGNRITLSVLEGGWIVFDQVYLEGPKAARLGRNNSEVFIRDISPAPYELKQAKGDCQPLLIDVERLAGKPKLSVTLDGKPLYETVLDTARYVLEVPMPAVKKTRKSRYQVLINDRLLSSGNVTRSPQPSQSPADYVDTKMGTAHSRWMIAPGPWMPFSMVKLSPDNQNMGWQAGYQPTFETIGTFSHIHEWTMAGLGMMPTNGPLMTKVGDQFSPDKGYRSRIDKSTEEAPLGFYKVHLTDPDIWAEVTATERASFQKYTFPNHTDGRVMIDLHVQAEYDYLLPEVHIRQVSDTRIEGFSHQISPRPHVWSNDADQEYVVHFVIEFDRPIKKVGGWINDSVVDGNSIKGVDLKEAGLFVEFDTRRERVVQVRTGISLVSIANAGLNLQEEITGKFGWDFEAVVQNQKEVWNDILNRLVITTDDRMEKVRFYTNMYRAFCRNTWSDVNGEWMSPSKKVQKFTNPDHVALGCDAFWNTFWNLNQLWNLITPEWSSKWVNSQLAMYDSDGWLAKGPAGMKYIPVMVAEHEIPLIVSTYQMGIRDYDAEKAFEAVVKMQTTPARPVAGGFAGNRDLVPYLKYKYVPVELGRFSNTLEYAYDDWTVAQFAKALGKKEAYDVFSQRGEWWRNAINPANGYAHLRDTLGRFAAEFDPFQSGRNHHYVEGNAWQLSFFVPQNMPGLIQLIGEDPFVERLDWGFQVSEPWRYNAPNDQYWDYPVVQGNQQSMHFAFLFNWAKKPWLTQKWSRSIIDRYYGYGTANAYLGDEDQGQMSAWFVMAALGLFQTDGGASVNPVYEIASPLYEKVEIDLGEQYGRGRKFIIKANHVSRANKYVQSATLNGTELNDFFFPASELLKGGELILDMGDKPNTNWGTGRLPNQ